MIGPLLAHGIGTREDLPLPFGWAVTGAVAAIVISFLALGVLWRDPRLTGAAAGRPLPRPLASFLDAPWTRRAARLAGVVATLYVLLAVVYGPDDARNPTPHVIYVLLWVGLVPVSVVFGPVWRWVNPVRSLHALLNRGLGLDPSEGLQPLPVRWGWWPSAGGLVAFAWLELVYPEPADLDTLRVAIALYVATHLLLAFVFGSAWFEKGDAFEAWSTLFGRLSPIGRRDDGRLVVRSPLNGPDALAPAPGLVAVAVVMLGTTVFDGVSGSSPWQTLIRGTSTRRLLFGTAGVIATMLVLGAAYVACTTLAGRIAGVGARGMPVAFAHTLLPVALGYMVAHYYSLLVFEGQRAFVKLSDPLGTGANWLGFSDRTPNSSLIDPTLVATVQVVAIIVGHVLGVVLSHDRAVRLFPRRRTLAAQVPLLVLMVGLTCLGLFLLFEG